MRLYCDIEGLQDNWVDVADAWTRKEFRQMVESDGADFLEMFHAKVTGCHIESGDESIDDPAGITEDALDDIDMRLVGFLGSVLVTACVGLRSLGNVSARMSSNGTAPQPSSD
jgi:hypothetical protein